MKAQGTDIDIDLADREKLLRLIDHIPAMQKDTKGRKSKHNTGVYFHDIPKDPFTGLCTLDYKEAEDKGYFKIDVLNVGLYQDVKDPDHLDRLAAQEPDWTLLEHRDVIGQLFHIHGHADLVMKMRPQSLEQLAMVLALIRPAKRHLIGKTWREIAAEIWKKPAEGYYFKRSHSYSYAQLVMVHMNLLSHLAD